MTGDSRLVVSFERRPRIRRYRSDGRRLGGEPLPRVLASVERYADDNLGLEGLTWHRRWGFLTAPEQPLAGAVAGFVPIYAVDGSRFWPYPLHSAPNSALVAMEALPDGSLLTLERAYVSPLSPLVIALRRARLPSSGDAPVAVENVAVFDTSKGGSMDNFEGLTRHRGQRFFMVSDDNRRILQKTLLVYFELRDAAHR